MEGQGHSKELIYKMVQLEREWKAFVGAYEKGEPNVNGTYTYTRSTTS